MFLVSAPGIIYKLLTSQDMGVTPEGEGCGIIGVRKIKGRFKTRKKMEKKEKGK